MHSLRKHLENISSITIICGMTYSKYLWQSLRCHLHFFHSSFSSFSLSWGKKHNLPSLQQKYSIRSKKQMTTITRESAVSWLVVFLYFRVSFISGLSRQGWITYYACLWHHLFTHVYPSLSTFYPVYSCLPKFIHVLPRLLMFTQVYPQFLPLTHVHPSLSTFYPVYPCLPKFIHILPRLLMFTHL